MTLDYARCIRGYICFGDRRGSPETKIPQEKPFSTLVITPYPLKLPRSHLAHRAMMILSGSRASLQRSNFPGLLQMSKSRGFSRISRFQGFLRLRRSPGFLSPAMLSLWKFQGFFQLRRSRILFRLSLCQALLRSLLMSEKNGNESSTLSQADIESQHKTYTYRLSHRVPF